MKLESGQNEIVQALLQMEELKHLGSVALVDIANAAKIQELSKGDQLHAEQFLDNHVYLISGEMEISAGEKKMSHIVAGTERSSAPIFRVHTQGLMAKCLTPVRLLSIDEAIINRYIASIQPKDPGGIQVEEYSDTSQEASIIGEIHHVFDHNEVDLPSLPEVAMRIQRAVNDPKMSLRDIATDIQTDPMIAARVIQVANSAMFYQGEAVASIQLAISRIGLKSLQTIVMSVVLCNLFKPKSALLHKRAARFYSHSIRVGAICYILAKHLENFDQEHALLAGLLHDIGIMPILILSEERTDLSTNPELLEVVIQNLSGMAGSILLKQWGFGSELQMVAKESQEWQRQIDKADYCDLVQAAQLHCQLVGGDKIDAPALKDIPAFSRLHLEKIDPEKIIHEARDEIHDIVSSLLG